MVSDQLVALSRDYRRPRRCGSAGTRVGTPPDSTVQDAHLVVRWAGVNTEVITASEVRPGDTLVVPAARGGLRKHNWDPRSREEVGDLGDRAQLAAGLARTLRLHTRVIAAHVEHPESLPAPPYRSTRTMTSLTTSAPISLTGWAL